VGRGRKKNDFPQRFALDPAALECSFIPLFQDPWLYDVLVSGSPLLLQLTHPVGNIGSLIKDRLQVVLLETKILLESRYRKHNIVSFVVSSINVCLHPASTDDQRNKNNISFSYLLPILSSCPSTAIPICGVFASTMNLLSQCGQYSSSSSKCL
jgi:hypothetical protein